ncbi:MAG: nucleotidyltransferase family protein [Lachnospiraceae bacterium]|nr:nucleotidyltransferase family protein [Lachnospiraceae bacterium]
MKVAAIIAEYNPFHTGHKHHLSQTKELTGADYVLVIMSGDYVQRGAPALLNKYTRARMALLGGADVVLELPVLYATSSAEYFAQSAVTLAQRLGVVDILSFGSESGSLDAVTQTASALLDCESNSSPLLQTLLRSGLSYAAAKEQLLADQFSSDADLQNLLSQPNNILGVEYCKALLSLKSSITPFTITRQGNDFHDTALYDGSAPYLSAAAIRDFVQTRYPDSTKANHGNLPRELAEYIPSESRELFHNTICTDSYLVEDDLSDLLLYKLLCEADFGFDEYLDCTPSLSNRIVNHLPYYTGYTDYCALLKTKDVTYTRISRMLLHILLELRTPDFYKTPYGERDYYFPFVRLLGFRESTSPLLFSLKKNSSVPLVTKLADAQKGLSFHARLFLKKEVFASALYEAVSASKSNGKKTALNEFRQSPIIIS